ncbi:RagB/SusD family nutrient uptake outer membrane protein [Lacibacter sp. H375]|uniref:RagB/SusD family nutrient uptake outer membrane protein n=1 Tax=Lacibacter sp. H375 TaxID=3133424 RepID=UPI0030BEF952
MIRSIKNKLFLLLVAAVAFTSCKKSFLELNPPTSLTPGQALATEADLQVALRGAYAGLRGVDYFGRTVPILGDIMADNTYQHAVNTNRYTLFNNYSFVVTDGNALGLWTSAYSVILRANNIINSPVASNANVNQYKGEAYALRALSYFTLVRYFSKPFTDAPDSHGVPLVTTYNPDDKPGRATVAQVYALILSDLTQAYTLMTKYTNSSQFSKYAAKGLEAKVHMTMGTKAAALTAALDVINNGGFGSLTAANHAAYWTSPAIRTDKLETLFEVSSDAVGNLSFDALSYLYSQAGNYGDLVVADDLYALFGAADVRKALYPVVPRPAAGASIPTVNKYPAITGDLSETKVLRLSEMYLIAAEASLPANEVNALTYVNYITSRRGADAIASTGNQLFEDIITERRKELAFEGDRYMDLQRLKRTVSRSTNYPAAARTIDYTNFRRILPIPQSETDANPTIKAQQNSGYN